MICLTICTLDTHSGSVNGVVSLGSVAPPPSWFGVFSSSVLTSTIGSLHSSLLLSKGNIVTRVMN